MPIFILNESIHTSGVKEDILKTERPEMTLQNFNGVDLHAEVKSSGFGDEQTNCANFMEIEGKNMYQMLPRTQEPLCRSYISKMRRSRVELPITSHIDIAEPESRLEVQELPEMVHMETIGPDTSSSGWESTVLVNTQRAESALAEYEAKRRKCESEFEDRSFENRYRVHFAQNSYPINMCEMSCELIEKSKDGVPAVHSEFNSRHGIDGAML